MKITPKNWAEFQHYKDRDPPWIKLHKKLLDNFEFQSLPVDSRALAPMLWLLASEDKEGVIDAQEQKLAFRLRMTAGELMAALLPLIEAGFFGMEQDASAAQAPRKRDAMPETEVETQEQAETQGRQKARSADADVPAAFESFNAVAREVGWPEAQQITKKRRSAMRLRLAEAGGIAGWHAGMAKARASAFLRGEKGRDKNHENWAPDIDFFLQQGSFTKLMEGKYDDRSNNQEPSGFAAVLAGGGAALARQPGRNPNDGRPIPGAIPGTN